MAEHRTSYVLNLKGNLDNRARRYSRSMQRFSRNGQRSMTRLQRSTHALGKSLDRLGNKYVGILTGGTALATGRYLSNLDTRLTRLGTDAGATAEQIDQLKDRVFEVAQMPEIRVNPKELISAVDMIINKIGDLDFARDNLRNIGIAMQATGANGQAVGKVFAEMRKMGIKSSADILHAIDVLNVQGKKGAFDLAALAQLGPKVITAYTAQVKGGRDPATVLREMGAALQVIRRGSQNAEEAATAFSAVLRDITDPKKIEKLNDLGIQVFDPEAAARGEEVLRPINELMTEIMRATEGRQTVLGMIFGDEARRAFNQVSPELMQEFYNVQADGSRTIKDSARNAETLAAALTSIQTALKSFADSNLTEYIKDLADAINSLDPDTINRILKGLSAFALGTGGLIVGRKLFQAGRWASTPLRSAARRARGGGMGGGVGRASGMLPGGVQKVYVVNMRGGGGMMGGGTASETGRRTTRRGGRLGRLTKLGALGVLDSVALPALGGYAGARAIDSGLSHSSTYRDLSKKVDEIAYTGISKALGAVGLGDYATSTFDFLTIGQNGAAVADRLEQASQKMQDAAERMANSEIDVNVEIDQDGRAAVNLLGTGYRNVGAYYRDPYAGPMTTGGS